MPKAKKQANSHPPKTTAKNKITKQQPKPITLPEISWQVPEYEKHTRDKKWYLASIIIGILFLLYAWYAHNILFGFIVVLAGIVLWLREKSEPMSVTITLTPTNLIIGKRWYDYDEFKNFSIIYKPEANIKQLYFEFSSPLKHRLSIPLQNTNPLEVRKFLLKYLDEDLERVGVPYSEYLTKLFKL